MGSGGTTETRRARARGEGVWSWNPAFAKASSFAKPTADETAGRHGPLGKRGKGEDVGEGKTGRVLAMGGRACPP